MLSGFFMSNIFLYICSMINEYIREKRTKKEHQILLAWKQFYVECLNEWETSKIDRRIERFKARYLG